jgi:hypothetical protein
MTRYLSESLQAIEPAFRNGLHKLETANGHPNTDIRFTAEVRQAAQAKLRELGLDPRDTTAEELYHVLQARIQADDARLTKRLRTLAATHVSAEADVVAGMVHALEQLPDSKRSFALKPSVLKALIKQQPPKKAMKQLGYRSLDSFLKHESPALILTAAWLSESMSWRQRFIGQYDMLKASDFEDRKIALLRPQSPRWHQLARSVVAQQQHNLLAFKELGAMIFLPLPQDAPAGTTTASLALALHDMNEIRAAGTFLKLCQVRPDFGRLVRESTASEPQLQARQLDRPVPWHLIQRHYAESPTESSEAFEPHVRLEDIAWHPIEQTMAAIEPSLKFWQDTAHLGLLRQGQVVSLNLIDSALNFCNQLPFEQRAAHYFRNSLWNELLLRYLHHSAVEQTIADELQPQFAMETVESAV